MIDVMKVAGAALDEIKGETLLAEHDARYHGGRYRGGKCLYREKYYGVDMVGGAKAKDVEEVEGRIESARRFEQDLVEREFSDAFGIDQKKGMRRQFLEPDGDGVNQMEVVCRDGTPDSFIDEAKAKKFFKKMGYEFRGMSVGTLETKGFNGKPRKVFRIDVYKPEKFAEKAKDRDDVGVVSGVEHDLSSEQERSDLLKRYGFKYEDGKAVKRTDYDDLVENARKYLGIR